MMRLNNTPYENKLSKTYSSKMRIHTVLVLYFGYVYTHSKCSIVDAQFGIEYRVYLNMIM
jgi:hypothetical protein